VASCPNLVRGPGDGPLRASHNALLRGLGVAASHPSSTEGIDMDLQLPIVIIDELADSVVRSTATLDLASGEIRGVQYQDYDFEALGLPAEDESYEFTSGMLSNAGRDVEFRVEVDAMSGKYSVTASELLELKGRAAKLFTQQPGPK
jgi:hypothetical protein